MWRLIVAILLLLLSLLVLVKAPTNFFWKVTIAIVEFPYIPVALSVAFLISCFYAERYKLTTILISGVALLLYILPLIQVYALGKNLSAALSVVFPFEEKTQTLKHPFTLSNLLTGVGINKMAPEKIIYKELPGKQLSLDFYSAGKGIRPCVIVIHGGSWAGGDSKQLPELNHFLRDRGYHVAALNYRLAPEYKSPAPVEDTKDALRYLKEHLTNVDPNNFVLLGRSAGAQIALVAAYTFHDPSIKGVISYYGPADMVWGARIKSNKLVLNTDQVFRDYLGGLIDEVPEKYHEASAYDFAESGVPPTLLIHGPNDPMVSYYHSVRLAEKLKEKNVPCYFLDLPWATHGCDYNLNGPSGQICTYSVERFINSVTKK